MRREKGDPDVFRTGQGDEMARADAAERAVLARYAGGFPGVAWARSTWPTPRFPPRRGAAPPWHYWWSAHLVDATVDAHRHRPTARRRRRLHALARGIRLRNGGWGRVFFDDVAWLGLAFHRGRDLLGRERVVERIARRLEAAVDRRAGAIPWRVGDDFFNAPANGPAAILLARTGRLRTAARLADWMHEHLRDPGSGLIRDGLVITGGERRVAPELYTYCQGVALGAQCELVQRLGHERFLRRATALVEAVASWTGPALVLPGAGGGDGGLFAAIACRYLAEAVPVLEAANADAAARTAGELVRRSADAVWEGRGELEGHPVFAADWRRAADLSPTAPERDLSVQLGGWMTLEVAAGLTRPRP